MCQINYKYLPSGALLFWGVHVGWTRGTLVNMPNSSNKEVRFDLNFGLWGLTYSTSLQGICRLQHKSFQNTLIIGKVGGLESMNGEKWQQ